MEVIHMYVLKSFVSMVFKSYLKRWGLFHSWNWTFLKNSEDRWSWKILRLLKSYRNDEVSNKLFFFIILYFLSTMRSIRNFRSISNELGTVNGNASSFLYPACATRWCHIVRPITELHSFIKNQSYNRKVKSSVLRLIKILNII